MSDQAKSVMFDRYKVVFFQLTPRWIFNDLHVDSKTGLPDRNPWYNVNEFFCTILSHACCNKRICTLCIHSTKYREFSEVLATLIIYHSMSLKKKLKTFSINIYLFHNHLICIWFICTNRNLKFHVWLWKHPWNSDELVHVS